LSWIWGNTKQLAELATALSVIITAISAWVAAANYRRSVKVQRAQLLSSLYTKFYEALDLKAIRAELDEQEPDSERIQNMVDDEEQAFTDYLNFFEFMAYLEDRREITPKDAAAMFDYYLSVLNKHTRVRDYVNNLEKGYGYLSDLIKRFPWPRRSA
jgi:hypothetical protein